MSAGLDEEFALRIRLLETSLAVQEQMMTVVHEELIEASRLTESMRGLSEGASTLAAALVTVHENQERLCGVEVKVGGKASHEQLDAVEAAAKASRRRLLIGGVIALVSVVLAYLVLAQSSFEACENRQASSEVVARVLESFTRPGAQNDRIAEGARLIRETLAESCQDQYPARLKFWA